MATITNPLHGLRVIDLTDDSGRFATKLLTEMGADVVRITANGSSGHVMADARAAERGGVLDWWYDGGKRRHLLDLDTQEGRDSYRQLVSQADLVIETEEPDRLEKLGIDHAQLLQLNPCLAQVSITPFGRTGPRRHWVTSDLVSAAMGGSLSVTGLPERPLNIWGRQVYNYVGFMGVLCGLSAVFASRQDNKGRHVDVSIHETLTGSIEHNMMQWYFDDLLPLDKVAKRQGALHWLRAYDIAACRTGYTMITPTPDSSLLIDWLIEDGISEARQWQNIEMTDAVEKIDDIMDLVRSWVKQYDSADLWWQAQQRHVAFGGVMDVPAVAGIPQFEHRQFFAETDWEGPCVRQPSKMVRFSNSPNDPPRPPALDESALDEIISDWQKVQSTAGTSTSARKKPLEGIRVADFTWVLAGPFCTRMLGDLGADIVKIQNEEKSTLVNLPDFPYYFVWNREKRSATLNMKHPDALATVRRLIENCDVLIENYSAGVLDTWGLDWQTVHEWNPRLVYVSMSGCGHDGPWQHVISYAPTIHALSGITHLTNFPDRGDVGPGYSLNDHLAGFSAATSTMAALYCREQTGEGQKIDMAQLEIGTYAIGPALIDHFANQRDAKPNGNVDGLQEHVPNEVYSCRDGFLAVTVTSTTQWRALTATVNHGGLTDPEWEDESCRVEHRSQIDKIMGEWLAEQPVDAAMEILQEAGVPAGKVQNSPDLVDKDAQHLERRFWQSVTHDVYGERSTDTFPALWDGERLPTERLSPAYLGEHNFEVWTELAGLTVEDVAAGMAGGLFA